MTTTNTTEAALERAAKRAAARRAKLEQADREIAALEVALRAVTAHHDAATVASPEVEVLDAAADVAVDVLYVVLRSSDSDTITDSRRESLRVAIHLGADRDALRTLAQAIRLARDSEITLPSGRYAGLSRGRGWCRRSDGTFADRETHQVGPGKWTVGSTDGFKRQSRVEWVVEHVRVGDQTWTVAS